jgi:SAM-dependent methyltransferase
MDYAPSAVDLPAQSVGAQSAATKEAVSQRPARLDLERVHICPMCGSGGLRRKFDVRHIAGDPLHAWAIEQGFASAPLVVCRDCGFQCKSLRPSPAHLDRHYAQQGEAYVQRIAEDLASYREDYRVAREILSKAFPRGGSILDVGCASGFFLESLGEKWNAHGLEIFRLAAQQARARGGITVHECDIASAGFEEACFDVVCSFDVVEHLADPMPFFREARRILKPSGLLLLGTGAAGSLAARMSGSRWTYFCIPEHVSFFSRRSLRSSLHEAGFSNMGFSRIHHGERNASVATAWLRAVGKHWAVTLLGENVVRLGIFRQKTSEFLVPYFFDHMICVAR